MNEYQNYDELQFNDKFADNWETLSPEEEQVYNDELESDYYMQEDNYMQKHIEDVNKDYMQKHITDEEYNHNLYLLNNCEDINVLEQAVRDEKENAPYNQLQEWQREIISTKTTKESWCRFIDRNHITGSLAIQFFKKGSRTLDDLAMDYEHLGLTPEDIGYFMLEVANNKELKHKTTPLYWELKKKVTLLKNNAKKNERLHNVSKVKINKEKFNADKNLIDFCKKNSIILEKVGTWMWLSNTVYNQKEQIKSFGFRWSKNRKQWYKK